MSSDKTLGVTPPVSVLLPTEAENKLNVALIEELRNQGTFEAPADTEKRHKVLESLQRIVDEFVRRVTMEKEPNKPTLLRAARGQVFTYGSFRLGVYGPGSDIDTLVVAPKYVTREDYFRLFPRLLEEMAPEGAITGLSLVQDAYVPIIKFEYWEISIDLIFSRIAMLQQLPAEGIFDLKDSNLLRGLDERDLRALNGTRVTDEILDLVPEKATFRLALRAIKLWAQRRAIYANIVGFPGGVAWAMLVARVCQLYPKANSATIVHKFFHILRLWPWPQPVLLKKVESGPLQVRVWNPQLYSKDTQHLMPVITPAYPSMCATHNITPSTMAVIQRELELAGEITEQIVTDRKPWHDLFARHSFFTNQYKYYLAIISSSTNKEAHKIWSSFVESKVRILVAGIGRHEGIAVARPFTKGYDRVHLCPGEDGIRKVQDGSMDYLYQEVEDSEESDKTEEASTDKTEASATDTSDDDKKDDTKGSKVYTTTYYIGLDLKPGAKKLDVAYQVLEFKETCFRWDKFDRDVNFLSVQHVRNYDLPEDVFQEGEKKPQKKGAAKDTTTATADQKAKSSTKKRKATADGSDGSDAAKSTTSAKKKTKRSAATAALSEENETTAKRQQTTSVVAAS